LTLIRAIIDDTLAQGVPELFLVEEEYRLALLDAESSFVERFIGRITEKPAGAPVGRISRRARLQRGTATGVTRPGPPGAWA
jgi:hypothetical protein